VAGDLAVVDLWKRAPERGWNEVQGEKKYVSERGGVEKKRTSEEKTMLDLVADTLLVTQMPPSCRVSLSEGIS
jgi:hypothetical protein